MGEVELVNIDIEEDEAAATFYSIRGVPTLILFEDGKEVKRKTGVLMADQIKEFIK